MIAGDFVPSLLSPVAGAVSELNVVALPSQSAVSVERGAELAPHGNLHGVMPAPCGGAQPLLREQCGARKPCRVVGQRECAVRGCCQS